MTNLKRGVRHNFVLLLQEMLNTLGFDLKADGYFGAKTEAAVKEFQQKNNLKADGIVGVKTWEVLNEKVSSKVPKFVSEKDFKDAALALNVDPAVIKAVQEVETGGRRGFLTNGKPVILFEGHVFWRELKKRGMNPGELDDGNGDILYPEWTKKHYRGGEGEYDRLNRAKAIHEEAALCSASWGMFQIMGFNYALCGFESVADFAKAQHHSEGRQLMSFVNFIMNGSCLKPLKKLDWQGFAKCYNGPGYAANKYHVKLEKAYNRYTK